MLNCYSSSDLDMRNTRPNSSLVWYCFFTVILPQSRFRVFQHPRIEASHRFKQVGRNRAYCGLVCRTQAVISHKPLDCLLREIAGFHKLVAKQNLVFICCNVLVIINSVWFADLIVRGPVRSIHESIKLTIILRREVNQDLLSNLFVGPCVGVILRCNIRITVSTLLTVRFF